LVHITYHKKQYIHIIKQIHKANKKRKWTSRGLAQALNQQLPATLKINTHQILRIVKLAKIQIIRTTEQKYKPFTLKTAQSKRALKSTKQNKK